MIKKQTLTLDVLKVTQPIGSFFIASISAKKLCQITYNDVRRLAEDQRDVEMYLGIQRPLKMKRVKDIREYIDSSDATFPTAVIVSIDEKCVDYKESEGVMVLSPFDGDSDADEVSIPYDKIARVLDGQHRLASFLDKEGTWWFPFDEEDFEINLSIFVGADISEQANIFATVNLTQTKVNKSLAYDLTELAKTNSPFKSCHNVAVALDKEPTSPFFQRIKRLGTATPGRRKEPLTQASFVEALVKFISPKPTEDRKNLLKGKKLRKANAEDLQKHPFRNLFVEGKDLDIAEILYNYFTAIKDRWPDSWEATEVTGNLLPRSNTFKAFMKFLKEDVYPALTSGDPGRIPPAYEFSPFLEKVKCEDKDFRIRNIAPGSGGQATFLRLLRGEITLDEMVDD